MLQVIGGADATLAAYVLAFCERIFKLRPAALSNSQTGVATTT